MNYSSQKWKKKRAKILRLEGYKDVVAGRYGRTEAAQVVHHIYSVAKKDSPLVFEI